MNELNRFRHVNRSRGVRVAFACATVAMVLTASRGDAQGLPEANFPDDRLRTLISQELKLGPNAITPADVRLKLKRLRVPKPAISSLAGLETAQHLEWLNVTDASMLSNAPLTRSETLQWLIISRSGLYSLRIDAMPTLRMLSVTDNMIEDLRDLRNAPSISHLSLDGNPLSAGALAPVGELEQLSILSLANTPITDIEALRQLRRVEYLYLGNAPIEDIGPLATIGPLKYVDIRGTRVRSVGALAANAEIPADAVVQAEGLELDGESLCEHVPALLNRGVRVYYSGNCPDSYRSSSPEPEITLPLSVADAR
jgi:Leucine-rich repeat (LRR) protein